MSLIYRFEKFQKLLSHFILMSQYIKNQLFKIIDSSQWMIRRKYY